MRVKYDDNRSTNEKIGFFRGITFAENGSKISVLFFILIANMYLQKPFPAPGEQKQLEGWI